ncbi:hypothetical protein [Burkholderia sp. ISTR5]|uniref:hypothetical protein n=1 Tax=Burkholderia sp. ISTR5 TaxID=2500161 RepID=UPI00137110EC|nr:hypothetical protein [Burkholderia sp. ISTR5]NBI45453.1 hypothetical protein [Burkholderia sp. ISTR5]
MTALIPNPGWPDVPQLEADTLAKGGPGGSMNLQAQALLDRTESMNPDNLVEPSVFDGAETFAMRKAGEWVQGKLVSFVAELLGCVDAKYFQLKANAKSAKPTDDRAALQNAVDLAQGLGLAVRLPRDAHIYLGSGGITFKHGQSATDPVAYVPRLIPNGATLYPGPGVLAIDIVPRCTYADRQTSRGSAAIQIAGGLLTICGDKANAASSAMNIGRTAMYCDAFAWHRIDDVLIHHFPDDATVLTFNECRHFHFGRMAVRSGGIQFQASTPGSFCGDMIFDAFEARGSKTHPPVAFVTTGGAQGTPAEVRGIRFNSPTIYGSGLVVTASGYTQIGDIWFDSGQWDSTESARGECAVELAVGNSGAAIFNVKFNQPYFAGYNGAAIYVHATGGGVCKSVEVNDIYANSMTLTSAAPSNADANSIIAFQGTTNCSVNGATFDNVTGEGSTSALIVLDATVGSVVTDVKSGTITGVQNGVAVGKASNNNYRITDNTFNTPITVNEWGTGSPNRLLDNNLGV